MGRARFENRGLTRDGYLESGRVRITDLEQDLAAPFSGLFRHMADACTYCRMLVIPGRPLDYTYLAVNVAFEKLTGLSKVVGRNASEVLPGIAESDPVLLRLCARVSETGIPEKAEIFVAAMKHWLSVSTYSREPGYFVAMFGVITERKRAEEELVRSNAKLAATLASITDAVMVTDAEGRLVEFNDAFAAIHRIKRDVACGRPIPSYLDGMEFFSDSGEPASFDTWAVPRALHGEKASNVEFGVKFRDTGEFKIVTYSFGPIRDGSGKLTGSVVVGRDVTEQKQAELRLRESASRFRAILDASPVPMFLHDRRERITFLNRAFAETLGYSIFDTPTLERFWELGCPDADYRQWTMGTWYAEVDRTQRTSYPQVHQEVALRCKDGTSRTVLVTVAQLDNSPDGERIAALYDITERRCSERERADLEAQLQQAQKMESVGRLAGGVAHDFNNMLGAILGHAESAMESLSPTEPTYSDLVEIRKAAQRSTELTRQLLTFARKQRISTKVLNPNQTIGGMLKMLKRLIGEDIALEWRPHPELWSVKIDPSQLDQILANLCINARDAINDGGSIRIETHNRTVDEGYCATHAEATAGDYVELAVIDTGCGMNEETLSHAFEPFFTTKDGGRGTGLGLATVYGIAKQNSGFIGVCTELGRGTTFRVYIPRHVGSEEPNSEATMNPLVGGDETILVVEDEPSILRVASRVLERLGYHVIAAASPSEALQVARDFGGEIHLLVSDVVMPDMNGRELAQRLSSFFPTLRQLYMSGYTADVIAQHGVLEAGVYFIQKPFARKELALMVRAALDGTTGDRPSRVHARP